MEYLGRTPRPGCRAFLTTIHGARAIDTITRQALPGVDPEVEAQWITEAELNDVEGVIAIPGAVAFLSSLPGDQLTGDVRAQGAGVASTASGRYCAPGSAGHS